MIAFRLIESWLQPTPTSIPKDIAEKVIKAKAQTLILTLLGNLYKSKITIIILFVILLLS